MSMPSEVMGECDVPPAGEARLSDCRAYRSRQAVASCDKQSTLVLYRSQRAPSVAGGHGRGRAVFLSAETVAFTPTIAHRTRPICGLLVENGRIRGARFRRFRWSTTNGTADGTRAHGDDAGGDDRGLAQPFTGADRLPGGAANVIPRDAS